MPKGNGFMSYEAWRISYQSSESAARAAYKEMMRLSEIADVLLNHCDKDNGECMTCSTIVCPHKEPLHFHHDGCPACASESVAPQHEPIKTDEQDGF